MTTTTTKGGIVVIGRLSTVVSDDILLNCCGSCRRRKRLLWTHGAWRALGGSSAGLVLLALVEGLREEGLRWGGALLTGEILLLRGGGGGGGAGLRCDWLVLSWVLCYAFRRPICCGCTGCISEETFEHECTAIPEKLSPFTNQVVPHGPDGHNRSGEHTCGAALSSLIIHP